MSVEYHGWIVLSTSHDEWSDDDFEEKFRQVSGYLKALNPEYGHDPAMPDPKLLPQMVYLKGSGAESVDPVLRILEQIGDLFDSAYGDLVVCDDQDKQWNFSIATRYRFLDGKLRKEES